MKKSFWVASALALVAIIAAVVLLLLLPARGQEHPATVVEVVRRVDAHGRPKDDWQPAAVGMDIYRGGQVRTGAESAARLRLLEGIVRLSAETVFTVKESSMRQGRLVTTLSLQEGRLWAHLTIDQPHAFAVETGSAVAAVRDTHFSVQVADGETLLSVAEGSVVLTAQEQSVTVATKQQAIVRPGQPPSSPQPMSDEERALWATEGEMPEMKKLEPTPTITPVKIEIDCDVYGDLIGPAGPLSSRNPQTAFDVHIVAGSAAQVAVALPDGKTISLPPFGDVYGPEQRFHGRIEELPKAGSAFTLTALDANGTPIPGGVCEDVYLGGYEPDPPANVRAEVVEAGLLITWDPSPTIPGGFDPSQSPPLGYYQISLSSEGQGTTYGWNHIDRSLPETFHLIPFRRQDFGPGDRGMALEEMKDGVYWLQVDAFAVAPPDMAGHGNECSATDPGQGLQIIIEGDQVRIERPR